VSSVQHKEWSLGLWPCASEAGGAGTASQNVRQRSAGVRPCTGVLGELLGETALGLNGAGQSGLLVLRVGRQQVGNLTLLECRTVVTANSFF
jgi:hypothetical protein